MDENPFMILLYLGVAAYVGRMYVEDYRARRRDPSALATLPGATAAPVYTYVAGVIGALFLLGIETFGEIKLGVVDEQSELVWFMLFPIVAAGVVEEVIFRGYLVIDKRGRAALIVSCIGFSLLFAVIHMHLWEMEDGFKWNFTPKALFSTTILFLNSLWFYIIRFSLRNSHHSIFPCMLAHAASNLGVYLVKLSQGFIVF